MVIKNEWFREYQLAAERRGNTLQKAQPHQEEALIRLKTWFEQPLEPSGSLLVLPTGGGKTFTAMRFLCQQALSKNYKVLWLAHTHHLLEQAFHEFHQQIGSITSQRRLETAMVRVVSGEQQYSRVRDVKATDDLVIATLQTITRAVQEENLKGLQGFLNASSGRLLVVFDEAHHASAASYRRLLQGLRQRDSSVKILGLTATPLDKGTGWLTKLFPQKVAYQISPNELMAQGILAKPIMQRLETDFSPEISADDLERWQRSAFKDLPENIVESLARNEERNRQIVSQYVDNKKKYGKTIIFVDRWFQCEAIKTMLEKQKVKAGAVYSSTQVRGGTIAERNAPRKTENDRALQAFKDGDLDVLLNVRMLTEGTDVPSVQTVFLTRQTTSQILLTQMVGRALRGEKVGGTREAHVVTFADRWKLPIQFAEFRFEDGAAEETGTRRNPRAAYDLVSVELVSRFAALMDSGALAESLPFVSLIPLGWYSTTYTAVVDGTDDLEQIQRLVLVFDEEHQGFQYFLEYAKHLGKSFAEATATLESVYGDLRVAADLFFAETHRVEQESFLGALFDVARHIAHNAAAPTFFEFERRAEHDLDAIAQQFVDADLGPRAIVQSLETEYGRADRFWRNLYWSFDKFKEHHDLCQNAITMHNKQITGNTQTFFRTPEDHEEREPSDELKHQVRQRDGQRCVCCGSSYRLQIDHIAPWYIGGRNSLDNLQTLCAVCNNFKGTKELHFKGRNATSYTNAPATLEPVPWPRNYLDLEEWAQYAQRRVNFFYGCSATMRVTIGTRGEGRRNWVIELYQGNPVAYIKPFLKTLLKDIRKERSVSETPLESITVTNGVGKPIIVK